MKIRMRRGDTAQVSVLLTNLGEPWVPADETVVFAVGHGAGSQPLFTAQVVDGTANITHGMTSSLQAGLYKFDVRVYNSEKTLVATPCYGEFELLEVVNNDL